VRGSSDPRAKNHLKKLYPLDEKIIRLSRKGVWLRLRDLVRNIDIRGSIGSGKTVFVFNMILRCCLAAAHSAIILIAKPGAAAKAKEIAKYAGRGKDVRVIREGGEWHIEPIQWAIESARRRGVTLPLREAFEEMQMMIGILHRGRVSKAGDNFFVPSADELLHELMKALLLATGQCKIEEILHCARKVPDKPEAFHQPERYPIVRYLETIIVKYGRTAEVNALIDYFEEIACLSDKTRSSIVITLTTRIAPMMEEPIYSTFFKYPMNLTPEMIDREGLIVIVDFPVVYGTSGRCIAAAVKQMCQKWCLNRPQESEEERPMGIFQDEAAAWVTEIVDPEAAERGRSGRIYHVNTYQSHSTIVKGYGGGADGETLAKALTTNFVVRINASQIDPETRNEPIAICGKVLRWMHQVGFQNQVGDDGEVIRNRSDSFSLQYIPAMDDEYLLGLETGRNGYAEAVVINGGVEMGNGERYLKVRWYDPLGDGWKWWEPIFERYPTARPWVCSVSFGDFFNLCVWRGFWKAVEEWADFWTDTMMHPEYRSSRRGRHV
jgi:hypothetical protein